LEILVLHPPIAKKVVKSIDVKNIDLQIETQKNMFFHFYKKNIKKHA